MEHEYAMPFIQQLLLKHIYRSSLVFQTVKNLPAVQETWVWSLVGNDPLEKGMATHSNNLAWKIQWRRKPGGLQSLGPQRVRCHWVTYTFTFFHQVCSTEYLSSLTVMNLCLCVCMYVCVLSRVRLFATWWTVACQVPLAMKFLYQEYWSGLLFPSPFICTSRSYFPRNCPLVSETQFLLCFVRWDTLIPLSIPH